MVCLEASVSASYDTDNNVYVNLQKSLEKARDDATDPDLKLYFHLNARKWEWNFYFEWIVAERVLTLKKYIDSLNWATIEIETNIFS